MDGYRIYYSDNNTYMGNISQAPSRGVVAILCHDGQWSLWYGKDWYWYRDGQWFGGEVHGVIDHLLTYRTETFIFQGRLIPNAAYYGILNQAKLDKQRLNNG